MNYLELVKGAKSQSEDIMWKSIEHISNFIDQVEDKVPDMVREFMLHEYEMMNGPHFSEKMARNEVAKMHHYANDGSHIVGEILSDSETVEIVPDELKEECYWDAYVGANGIAHDLARVGMSKDNIIEAARQFWFCDDDFDDNGGKVWWYYTSKK